MKFVFVMVLFIACACFKKGGLILDQGVSAAEGGDATAIVSGCGNAPIVGYTYCRKTEGDATGEKIIFHVPKQAKNCPSGSPCTTGKLYRLDGSVIGIQFHPESTTAEVSWEEIIESKEFRKFDRGIYLFFLETEIIDPQGLRRIIFQEGEIRLRVISKDYVPLHEVPTDRNFTFTWKYKKWLMKLTSGGRAYASK